MAGLLAVSDPPAQFADARLQPGRLLQADLPRYGVNLGSWTSWGAEQLSANIIKNPGLQPGDDRGLLVAARTDDGALIDDAPWAARPAGFWTRAAFHVMSGAAQGARGLVRADQAGRLALQPWPDGLGPGDVVAVAREAADGPIPFWWTQGDVRPAPAAASATGQDAATTTDAGAAPQGRPVLLDARSAPAALRQYQDMLGDRAGKQLPITGHWRLSFWTREGSGSPALRVRFGRDRTPAWIDTAIPTGAQWRHHEIDFQATDDGPAGPLTLSFEVSAGQVALSDITLEAAGEHPGGFRPAVVETLRQLRPGYLRDWQGQLGDSAVNRDAPILLRHPTRYRAGDAQWQFGYGLEQLYALCAAVGARPWVVLPTALDESELRQLGLRIGELTRRYRIDETVVEYGNENWNSLFRPAGIANPAILAQVADHQFRLLRAAAGAARLHAVIGGQYVNPGNIRTLARASGQADGIGLAPYFLAAMPAGQSVDQALARAFQEDADGLARAATVLAGKALDVYEVNFHTISGDAPAAARSALLERPEAGAALAQRLMLATLAGSRRQAVYSLSGLDTRLPGATAASGADTLIPLWGITRDLAQAGHWRPTGQALVMLNEIAGGAVREVDCQGAACADLVALSFGDGQLAAVSRAPRPLRLSWPCGAASRLLLRRLDASAHGGSLPEAEPLTCVNGSVSLTLAPFSLLTLR